MCPPNDSEPDADHQRRDATLLINRQRPVPADGGGMRAFLRRLHSRLAGKPYSVCLLSDRAIRRYNQQYRHQDQATDVLSFPAGDRDYLGDILISVETARKNAAHYGIRLQEEIKLLILHGLLHLMGYDHETDHGEMARAERLWCTRLGLPPPLTTRAGQPIAAAGGRR